VKFIPSHVQFFSKSNSENVIKSMTKLLTKLSWFLFMAHGVLRITLLPFIFVNETSGDILETLQDRDAVTIED